MNRTWILVIIFLSTFISLSLYAEDGLSNPFMKIRVLGGLGLGSNEGLGDGTTTNNFSQEIRVQLLYNQSYQSKNKQRTQVNQQQQPEDKKHSRSGGVSFGGIGIDLGYIHLLTTESGAVNYFTLSLILLDVTINDIFIIQYGGGVAIPEDSRRRTAANLFIGIGIEIPISQSLAIPILLRYDIFSGEDDMGSNETDAISIFRLSTGLSIKL